MHGKLPNPAQVYVFADWDTNLSVVRFVSTECRVTFGRPSWHSLRNYTAAFALLAEKFIKNGDGVLFIAPNDTKERSGPWYEFEYACAERSG
jgi:hypothetical protein